MASRVRVYTIFPRRDGSFSTKTADYDGRSISVAAKSVKQAYWLAGNGVWADSAESPVGVLSEYVKPKGTRYWYDPASFAHSGPSFEHGAGVRAIRSAMESIEPAPPKAVQEDTFDADTDAAADLSDLTESNN